MQTQEEFEDESRRASMRLEAALAAYNAVWSAWSDLDARSVGLCRLVAMSAAIAAADSLPR